MRKIYREYETYIRDNYEQNREAADTVRNYLEHSSVAYHGRCVHTLHIPKVFSGEIIDHFKQIVDITYGIFAKIIRHYLEDPAYRRLFPFSEKLNELILVPSGYDSPLPIARFDIFFNEEDFSFTFCEINTDGTSAMNEDYVLNDALRLNPAQTHMEERYAFSTYELFDSWVRSFMEIYDTYEKKKEHPRVAIVDFMERASITEFEEFKKRFEQAGYDCEICEITKLVYRDHVLYTPEGRTIDVVYRRAVTTDVMEHYDEVGAFIEAVKNRDVCIIGSFATQIIHNKWLFKIIRDKETLCFLNQREQEFVKTHIPYTNLLDQRHADTDKLIEHKNRWIIKPLDSYASRGVFAGIDYEVEEWTDIIRRHTDKDYIYQRYCRPYQTDNIYFSDSDAKFKPYSNMSGLFVYNGRFAGVYSRLSDGGIISSQYNEKAVATLVAKEKQE